MTVQRQLHLFKGRFQPGAPARIRFERKFIPEPNSGCWLWFGAANDDGYGWFWLSGNYIKAARAAWLLYRGDTPDGLHVLHRCDNPACVNPDHLFWGTNADNQADKARKGRAYRGTPASAKLTPDKVLLILRAAGTMRMIARQFNVSPATICMIKGGKVWRKVTQGDGA